MTQTMADHKITSCSVCGEVREMPADHDMCMTCWENNGEPHPDSY